MLFPRAFSKKPTVFITSTSSNAGVDIHARQGELGTRRIQGVVQLVKQYGSAACDEACAAALELRVPEYRFVSRYLERSLQAPLSLRQIDPLIRNLTEYRDVIQQRIDFEESKS